MSEAYREMQDEDFATPNYAKDDAPVAEPSTVVERDGDDEVLDSTQNVRRAILSNLGDGQGGILNDKDSMALAIMTVRDMDAQALKKKGLNIKKDANKIAGDSARNIEAMQRHLIERGMLITASAPVRSANALDPRSLPKPTSTKPGEFSEQGEPESSAEFFTRMES